MEEKILLGHGSGGRMMNELIHTLIREKLGADSVQLDDSAVLAVEKGEIAFTTDTFTVTPIFFPGGDIGKLAVNGTVNDLAVMGATPLYLSVGLILEEGFLLSDLGKIMDSMRRAADEAGVKIVTGDTKVVEKGKGDKIFINTSGIGIFHGPRQRRQIGPGDLILINGFIGDHGIAIMAERNGLSFSAGLTSDSAPLNHLISALIRAFPDSIKFMRDATRGGLAAVLNEIVQGQGFSARLQEGQLPIRPEVAGVCDILGLDPLYAANEGKVVLVVKKEAGEAMVKMMRGMKEGAQAAVIGEMAGEFPGQVFSRTPVGGKRLLNLLSEEQLPRIC